MASICSVKRVSILPSLHLLPLFLTLVYGIQGATLREHRLSEPGSYEAGSQLHPPPSAEMLRALRYIQSLSQRTPSEPPADEHQPVDTDLEPDDMESVRSMLRLAAPARGSTGMERDLEEREDDNDKTQQWLQAVLTTLQQTEGQMVPQKTPQKMSRKITGHTSSPPRHPIQPRAKQQLEVETSSAENYERSSWGNPSNRRRHRQYPLMFEDEEQEQPLKRTNENAEEQYTPQKLATLQSVFEELSGISAAKTDSKRESAVASNEDDEDDDDDDLYRQRKMALEDIMGTDEWEPLEEQTEMEDEQRQRHAFDNNLDDDDDEVKRSNKPDLFQSANPEDIAKLVNLLKLLESKVQKHEDVNDGEKDEQETDREVEKKDADEEDEEERDEEEREIRPMHETFPQSLSQLITISQKLQIPPADVLDLLQNNQRGFPSRAYTPHKTYAAAPHQRPLQTLQRNSVAQDILSILELVSAAQQNDKLPQRPSQTKPSRYYEKGRELPRYRFPEPNRDDYDDTAGEEDELAGFLASEMLSQRPRRARLTPSIKPRYVYDTLERAVQDYFDKNAAEKRPVEHKSAATSLDDDTMMRILRYLEPESDDETDSDSKTVPEM